LSPAGRAAARLATPEPRTVIDFHNHLVPGVDDGAATLDEARAALREMHAQGVRTLVATPHLAGTLTLRGPELAGYMARVDEAWLALKQAAAEELPGLRLERGFEVNLDTPAPDLSDPRTRLAGTRFVLVEFPHMTVPPAAAEALFALKMRGWTPVVAHPERYSNLDAELRGPEEWRRVGAALQVNGGSVLGRYGDGARRTAWRLLRRGWADFVCSDYHARGSCHVADCRRALESAGGAAQAALLMEENPARLLRGEAPLPVPPLGREPRPLWKRLFGR
jgi:protein-tyrosine phosphatase